MSALAGGLALLATAATAQDTNTNRRNANYVEASFSTNEVLGQSVAHMAAASALPRPQDARLSRQDFFSLMVLLSLPNKHPQ
jgi:hypothetical protein